jgi:hypothetical protein
MIFSEEGSCVQRVHSARPEKGKSYFFKVSIGRINMVQVCGKDKVAGLDYHQQE